jgi:hypothetical protein
MTKMRFFTILLSTLCLVSCSEKPKFEELVNSYQINSNAFSELSSLACKLGKSRKLERYTPRKSEQERIIELDNLLAKIAGTYIEYRLGNNAQCTLEVLVYAQGFAGIGQKYTYTYQVDTPELYKKEIHKYNKIVSMKKNISFDMPLTVREEFDGWYFSFAYNHKS